MLSLRGTPETQATRFMPHSLTPAARPDVTATLSARVFPPNQYPQFPTYRLTSEKALGYRNYYLAGADSVHCDPEVSAIPV